MKWFPASISPYTPLIAAYFAAIYVCQIGYCVLLVIARKRETKVRSYIELLLPSEFDIYQLSSRIQATVVKGVGMALVFSNFVTAAWAITWV